MATNAIKYISNVGRSMGYAVVDQLKDMNPAIESFKDTNEDTLKTTYQAIRNIKSITKSSTEKLVNSKYGELAKTAKNNLFDDIKSGTFYNRERMKAAEQAAAANWLGDDDFDFEDEDLGNFDMGDDSNDDLMAMMDNVGEKTSTAISTVVARSAEYSVQATKELGSVIYNQNNAIYANIHANLNTMNDNLVNLVKFANGPVQTHLENSTKFFERETSLSEERNSILKEMLELQKDYYKPSKTSSTSSEKITMSDILDSNGMPDLTKYFSRIKQNIKNSSSGDADMIKMIMDSGALDVMIASPLEGVTKAITGTLIPKMLKSSMKSFNKSLSGMFSSLISNINDMEDYGFKGLIRKVFGIDDNIKNSIDTSNYEKGAVPFDGITRKSIVEVIPTYLAQIAAAVRGGDETRYDYGSGKFVKVKHIKENLDLINQRYSSMASSDLYPYINQYKSKIRFSSKEEETQFDKDLEKILYESYKRGKLFNSRKGSTAESYGLKGGKKSDVNLELIRAMFDRMPNSVKLQWANEMFYAKDAHNLEMKNKELSGSDITTVLFNGSIPTTDSKEAAPGKGTSIFSSIYEEVRHIREILESGNGKGSRKNKSKKAKTDKKSNNSVNAEEKWEGPIIDSNLSPEENRALFESAFNDEEDSSSIFEKVSNASGILNKSKTLFGSILEIPTKAVVKVLNKSEENMYNMVFGIDDKKENKWRKEIEAYGIGGAIIKRLQGTFESFNNWMDEKIFTPISKWLDDKNIPTKISEFFERIGLSDKVKSGKDKLKNSEFGSRFKDSIFGAGRYVKDTVKDASDELGLIRKLNEKGKSIVDQNNVLNDAISKLKGGGKLDNAAAGIKRVSKTGVVAVSEGEMIVPANLNPFNVNYNLKKENKAKQDFIQNFAAGGTVTQEDINDKWTQRYIEKAKTATSEAAKKKLISILESRKQKLDSSDYEEGRDKGILGNSINELSGAIKSLKDYIKSITPKKEDAEKEKDSMLNTAFGELKKYAPEATAGAVIGAGLSFIPGIIGGPLLGASVGAGISLIKNSDKVQNILFGELDKETNERKGGLLSKKISNNIQKYVPTMAKGATLGAITSILPFVPGGPVAGIILGSAAGFAVKNDKIHEQLFGEEGLIGDKFKDKVKKVLPKMGAGAIVGALAGPFGIGTNILLGSAVGFATSTDTFQNVFFGKKDKDGNRSGGAFQLMVDHMLNPIKDFGINTAKDLKQWAVDYIKKPLADAKDPLKQQLKLLFEDITGFFKSSIDRVMNDNIGSPFEKFLRDNLFKPATSIFKGFFNGLMAPIKFIASSPFKMIGTVGNHYRTKQVKQGTANYMTAAERLLYRKNRGNGITGRRWVGGEKGRYTGYDQQIFSMDDAQIDEALQSLQAIQNTQDELNNPVRLDAYEDFNNDIRKNMDLSHKETKKITDQIKRVIKGSKSPEKASDKINKIIANSNLSQDEKEKIAQAANKYLASLKDLQNRKGEFETTRGDILSNLKGIKIENEKDIPNIIKYLEKEQKSRKSITDEEEANKSPEEKLNDAQNNRHEETMERLDSIRSLLKAIAYPDSDAKNKFLDDAMTKYDAVDEKTAIRKAKKEESKKKKEEDRKQKQIDKANKLDRKNAANRGIRNWLFGNKTINWKDVDSYDPLTGARKDLDSNDIDTDGITVDSFKGRLRNTKQSAEKAYYTFVNGKPIRYIKDKWNKLTMDTSDSETRETAIAIKQDEEEKKNFLSTFKNLSIFGKIKNKFGKNSDEEEEEDEDKQEGIVSRILGFFTKSSKVKKLATAAGIAVGLPLLVNLWTEKIWPVLEPIVSPIVPSIKEGANNLWEKAKAWLSGDVPGKDGKSGGLPGLFETLVENWANGFETIMTKIVPKSIEILIGALPAVITGVGKGIVKGLTSSIDNIINAGRPSTDSDKIVDQYSVVDKNTISELKSSNESSITKNMDLSSWKLSGTLSKLIGTRGSSSIYSTTDLSGNDLVTATSSGSTSASTAMSTITSGSNVYNIDNSMRYTLRDGTTVTANELLKSDQTVGYVQDENGNIVAVSGKDLLNYPELASSLGIESRRLTEDEKQKNSDNMGLSSNHTAGGALLSATAKGFLRGSTGPGKVVSTIGKKMSKVPVLKYAGYPLNAIGKGMQAVGEAGNKMLPSFITGNSKKTATSAAEHVAGEVVDDTVFNTAMKQTISSASDNIIDSTAKEVGEEVTKETAGAALKGIENTQKKGIISKIISWITKNLPDFITDSRIVKYFQKAATEAGNLGAKETAEASVKELAEKLTEKLATKMSTELAEAGGKAIAKASSRIATLGVAAIASAVIGFVNGWNNANNIIGVANDVEETNGFTKLMCGLVSALNEIFCFGLIPISTLFDIVLPLVQNIPLFKKSATDLIQKREESANLVSEFNEENGTNLTVEEYNKARKNSNKGFIKNSTAYKFLFGKSASIDDEGNYQKAKKGVIGRTKDNVKNFFMGNEKTGEQNIIGKISSFSKLNWGSLEKSWNWAIGKSETKASDDISSDKDNPLYNYEVIMANVNDTMLTPLHWVTSIGKETWEVAKPVFTTVSVIGNRVKSDATDGIKDAWNGDIQNYFDISHSEQKDNPLSPFRTILKGVSRFVVSPIALLAGVGGVTVRSVKSLVSGGKQIFSNVTKSEGELISSAFKGEMSISDLFTITEESDNEDTKPIRWISTATRGIARIFTGPVALLAGVGGKIYNSVKSLANSGSSAISYINKEGNRLSEYWNSDNLTGYWKNATKVDKEGLFGTLTKALNEIMRIIMFPIYGIKMLVNKIVKPIEKAKNWIQDKYTNAKSFVKSLLGGLKEDANKNYDANGSGLLKRFSGKGSGIDTLDYSQSLEERRNGTFISQVDSKYANKKFNTSKDTSNQTIGSSGCGPAAAAMVVNSFKGQNKTMTMNQAATPALDYKAKDGGVTADYFGDLFAKKGLKSKYIMDSDPNKRATDIAASLYNDNKVILMGRDITNKSKKDSPFGPNSHYVVATKMSNDGKYIYINDPESNQPEIAYPAEKILSSAEMGIAATAASGSGINRSKLKKYIGSGSTYGTDTIQYKTWTRLRGAGFSEAQTAGAMGNIEAESGFDSSIVERGSGAGFGLCQWTGGRRTKLQSYASSAGKNANDVNTQLDFLIAEMSPNGGCNGYATYQFMSTTYEGRKWSADSFQNATDVTTATKAFCYCFERPNAKYARIDTRIEAANKYLQAFTGVAGSSSDGSSESSSGSLVDKLLGVWDDLAAGYGLTGSSSDSSSSSSGSSAGSDKQQALVNKMKSVEGKLKYSQSARNPDYGSGDCSSTVQWAYKNVLGVDPGSWTGAQETDSDLYTVANSVNNPSILQPGDLILYRKGGKSSHVEMYAGNNQMIGHGGGMGPKVRALAQNLGSQSVAMVRRWTGFKDGSGSGLDNTFNANGGLNKQELRKIKSTMWIANNQDKVRDKDISKYREKQAGKVASNFSANGTAPGKTISSAKNITTSVSDQKSSNIGSTDSLQMFASMVTLLTKIVDNTSVLQSMVSVLSELLKVMDEESKLKQSQNNNAKQLQDIKTKKESLFSKLGSLSSSSNNEQVQQLVKNAEKLAKS